MARTCVVVSMRGVVRNGKRARTKERAMIVLRPAVMVVGEGRGWSGWKGASAGEGADGLLRER